jgi:hypothetical protein
LPVARQEVDERLLDGILGHAKIPDLGQILAPDTRCGAAGQGGSGTPGALPAEAGPTFPASDPVGATQAAPSKRDGNCDN